jgi:multidrug efflux system membrane fusion protein
VQPISVVFTLPESQLPSVLGPLHDGQALRTEAWDRGQKQMLASGRVASLDNQIDLTTGTVKLKASFANEDGTLFPNQFVNVRLLAETRKDAIIAPSAAIQRGRAGSFVYVVKPDRSVTQRVVETGAVEGSGTEITKGLQAGDIVVTDGIDQLREGAMVEVADAGNLLKAKPRGGGKGRNGHNRSGDADASGPVAETQSGPQEGASQRPHRRSGAESAPPSEGAGPDSGRSAVPAGQSMPEGGRRFHASGSPGAQSGPEGERAHRKWRGDGAASAPASN